MNDKLKNNKLDNGIPPLERIRKGDPGENGQ